MFTAAGQWEAARGFGLAKDVPVAPSLKLAPWEESGGGLGMNCHHFLSFRS